MTEVMVGVFDDPGNPWCVKCWASKSEVSTKLIMLGTSQADIRCTGCGRVLGDTFPAEEATGLRIHLDIEENGGWEDLKELDKRGDLLWFTKPVMQIARLPRGMKGGASSVTIRIDLPDGKVLCVETSMKLFLGAADAFRAAEGKA